MSLALTIASVAVIAAGVNLTVHQSKVNRIRSAKAKMMQETTELIQKRAEDEESANRAKARKEKNDRALAELQGILDEVTRRSEERKAFLEGYARQRAEPWSA
jgi:Flp pilus assembly protein TadB